MAEEVDWRLPPDGSDPFVDVEPYGTGALFRWRVWTWDVPHWDHDHCSLCWDKFGLGGELTEGWVTVNELWLCGPCFDDFAERFGWVVEPRA